MALLESGKIYDIKYFDTEGQGYLSYEGFMNKYKEVTGITDSEYSSCKSFTEVQYSTEYNYIYFNLPYINDPLIVDGEKYYLSFCFYKYYEDTKNNIYGTVGGQFMAIKEKQNGQIERLSSSSGSFGGQILDYGKINYDDNYASRLFKKNYFIINNYYPQAYYPNGVWCRIDTRFLKSHKFYTINFYSCNRRDKTYEFIFNYEDSLFFSPSIIVCDMTDQLTGKHYDSLFMTNPKLTIADKLQAIGILDNKGKPSYWPASFSPQVYAKNDNSLVLQKLQYGRLKSDNVYITNRFTNEKIKEITSLEKSVEYNDVWLKNILYRDNKKFIIGLDGPDVEHVLVLEDKENEKVIKPKIENYLKFSSDGDFILKVTNPGWDGTIEYSLDKKKNWIKWDGSELSGNAENSIYMRGIGNNVITGVKSSSTDSCWWRFTGNYIDGNIETLLDYKKLEQGEHPPMGKKCYCHMFQRCTNLLRAPKLLAPILSSYCYQYMFCGCTSLTKAPKLPATTLTEYCYYQMFEGCASLIEAPKLPATTLAEYCYYEMFSGCASLTKAPKLPATTLTNRCYRSMFANCYSLKEMPNLPATTLAAGCYECMFYKCTSLKQVPSILPVTTLASSCYCAMFSYTPIEEPPELPAMILADYCYDNMFCGCTKLKKAPKLPATTLGSCCYFQMFYDCDSLKQAPELPATTLAKKCYECMFEYCSSLEETPELPATTLAESCYEEMFRGCISIVKAPEILPATILTQRCYYEMFYGCHSLKQAPELPATTLTNRCYEEMFYNCGALAKAPKLPATALAERCYQGMFYNCTSLKQAPELPATTLTERCYAVMFSYTSIEEPPELPAMVLADYCYDNMFSNCKALKKAPKLPATMLAKYCYSYMFYGCESLNILLKLPAVTLVENCYYYMFYGCKQIKISSISDDIYLNEYRIPYSGSGVNTTSSATYGMYGMFFNTGGNFKDSPSINTIYYTSNEVI